MCCYGAWLASISSNAVSGPRTVRPPALYTDVRDDELHRAIGIKKATGFRFVDMPVVLRLLPLTFY